MIMNYEVVISYVHSLYIWLPMEPIQMTAMTQGYYTDLLHRQVFAQMSFHTLKFLAFDTQKLAHR